MKFILIIPFLIFYSAFSQVDFNNYTTLLSKGPIPKDFTESTFDKLQKDLSSGNKDLTASQEKVFFEGINYAIDDILHSGYVTYGDEISEYLGSIADKLLKEDKELRSKLRFYTLKSNSTNAFSTQQGIVFVTTGLISQVTSEAQIAFILAHEISHYQENHVVESFNYASKNRKSSIEQMSVYSKDKEFEADKKGLEMYRSAGYSSKEIISTFDVLLYSYLPFDEIDIDLSYFQASDSIYLPSSLFPLEKFEIKAVDDADDSRSSHPNIKTRKTAIATLIDETKNWNDEVNSFGEEKFNNVRNIARFESIRNDVIEAHYGKAFYSIYLLEKIFPESLYLKRMKAQAWLGILMYRMDNRISITVDKKSDYEGASASIHYMIREMTKDQVEAMAIRQIYDIQVNSEDEEIKLIWDKSIKTIVYAKNFNLSDFSKNNYYKAFDLFNEKVKSDTIAEEIEIKPKSKYDRIKTKKDVNVAQNFDSTEFQIYLIPDIISSDDFKTRYEAHSKQFQAEQGIKDAYDALSSREQSKYNIEHGKDDLKLGISDLIVVEPTVYSYSGTKVDRVRSEKLEKSFSEIIEETSQATGINVYPINSSELVTKGTQMYNERSTLLNILVQLANNDNIEPFPVDYQLLNQLEVNYGTSKVMFSLVEHSYDPDIGLAAVYAIIFFPVAIIYFPIKFITGHHTQINMIVLDTKEAKIIIGSNEHIKEKDRKHIIGAHMYSIFTQLNSTK